MGRGETAKGDDAETRTKRKVVEKDGKLEKRSFFFICCGYREAWGGASFVEKMSVVGMGERTVRVGKRPSDERSSCS